MHSHQQSAYCGCAHANIVSKFVERYLKKEQTVTEAAYEQAFAAPMTSHLQNTAVARTNRYSYYRGYAAERLQNVWWKLLTRKACDATPTSC